MVTPATLPISIGAIGVFAPLAAIGVGLALAMSLAVYGLIRAS